MARFSTIKLAILLATCTAVAACGGKAFGPSRNESIDTDLERNKSDGTLWDLFKNSNQESEVLVNKYIWSAAIEVLDFLPIQTIDPFTGVIVTGYGTPPSGGRAYRATVLISDPALDARSLNVALQTRSGAASAATTRAIEDAILSRARQLRIADNKL